MQKGWAGWLGFVVLCGLIFVSSCNAWWAEPTDPAAAGATVTEK